MGIILSGTTIIDTDTREVLGVTTPKFPNWKYKDYVKELIELNELRFLEPMTAQELEGDKFEEFLNNTPVLAEQKFDGHRGLLFLTSKGNRMFSRRISKQTGWYSENTDQMPHIRDIQVPPSLLGTVLDGEVLLPIENCSCRQVQSVTGALPETAIENQMETGFAHISVFDILYYKGLNVQKMPLWKRKVYLLKVLKELGSDYLLMCDMYMDKGTADFVGEKWGKYAPELNLMDFVKVTEDIEELFRDFLKAGLEGLIVKDVEGVYEQKRSKSFIKMKAHKTYDCVIMGYDDPTRDYTGKELATWEHYEGKDPVTKFYAMRWIGAIIFGVWKDGKLVEVGRTSGMDEATRQLISESKEEYLGQVIEVEAQGLIDKSKGSLQHPRFVCFRNDKSSEQCTFEAHIREY